MHRISNKMIVLFVTIMMLFGVTGCNLKPNQVNAVAQQTGLFAAVSWIAADNPTPEQIKAVSGVVDIIEQESDTVVIGKTFTDTIYPVVVKEVDTKFKPQYRPLAKAAALSLLGELDIMFALHPEWRSDNTLTSSIVRSFCVGARDGFALNETSPAMVQARSTATLRAKVK